MFNHISHKLFLIVLTLFAGVIGLYCADPSPQSLVLSIDFSKMKGQFDYWNSTEIPDEYGQYINNIDWSINGILTPRRGITIAFPGQNASNYNNYAGREFKVLISSYNDVWAFQRETRALLVHRLNDVNESNAWVSYLSEIGSEFSMVNDDFKLYVISEQSPMSVFYAGTPGGEGVFPYARVSTGTPGGRYATKFLENLVIAGATETANVNRIFFSSANQLETFPFINYLDIPIDTPNDRITCLGEPILGVLPIYSRLSAKVLTGSVFPDNDTQGNINVRSISGSIGCASNQSVKNLNNRQYFYSQGPAGKLPGIYAFNGISIQEMTKPIRNFFLTLDQSTTSKAVGYVYKNKYCLSISTPGRFANTVQVCLDDSDRIEINRNLNVEGFEVIYGTPVISVGPYNQRPAINGLAGFDQAGKSVDQMQWSNFASLAFVPVDWKFKTKDYDMGRQNRNRPKTADRAYVTFQKATGTLNIAACFDFGKSTVQWTIDMSTTYAYVSSGIITVTPDSSFITNKLIFPSGKKFNYVNFEIWGSTYASVQSIDFFATPEPFR